MCVCCCGPTLPPALPTCQVGAEVHQGLRLEFANRGQGVCGESKGGDGSAGSGAEEEDDDAGAGVGAQGGWRSGLDALSGGQRTLVSLAFVAAVGG